MLHCAIFLHFVGGISDRSVVCLSLYVVTCMTLQQENNLTCCVLCFRDPAERESSVLAVEKKMPKRVKRKRPIVTDDGLEAGMEEYYDYLFPEEGGHAPNLKLLEMAHKWKKAKAEAT